MAINKADKLLLKMIAEVAPVVELNAALREDLDLLVEIEDCKPFTDDQVQRILRKANRLSSTTEGPKPERIADRQILEMIAEVAPVVELNAALREDLDPLVEVEDCKPFDDSQVQRILHKATNRIHPLARDRELFYQNIQVLVAMDPTFDWQEAYSTGLGLDDFFYPPDLTQSVVREASLGNEAIVTQFTYGDIDDTSLVARVKLGDDTAVRELLSLLEDWTMVPVPSPLFLLSRLDEMAMACPQTAWGSLFSGIDRVPDRFASIQHLHSVFSEGVARSKILDKLQLRGLTHYNLDREEPLYIWSSARKVLRDLPFSDPSPSQDIVRKRLSQFIWGRTLLEDESESSPAGSARSTDDLEKAIGLVRGKMDGVSVVISIDGPSACVHRDPISERYTAGESSHFFKLTASTISDFGCLSAGIDREFSKKSEMYAASESGPLIKPAASPVSGVVFFSSRIDREAGKQATRSTQALTPLWRVSTTPVASDEAREWLNGRVSSQATRAANARQISGRPRSSAIISQDFDPRAANARQISGRPRFVDPTTCDRDYSAAETEFMQAIQKYKTASGRMFPTWGEVLEVLKTLGYEKPHVREDPTAGIVVAKDGGVYHGRKKGITKANPIRARELRDQGLTVPEIANALSISDRTVFRYLSGYHQTRKTGS